MGEKRLAFFYRDFYYLVPDKYSSFEEFLRSVDINKPIELRLLTENNNVPKAGVDKGICIAPYFYSEYGYADAKITICDVSDVFPVEVELFSQKDYNEKLREVILNYCPGCLKYKPISNRNNSLNGHFEEISLNSVCFYRQNEKPAPRVFRNNIFGLGGIWRHFDPDGSPPDDVIESIKSAAYIKYDSAYLDKSDPSLLHISFKPDFFVQVLSDSLSYYIAEALNFTEFRITFESQIEINDKEIKRQLSAANREAFQKNCKKYGAALAELTFVPEFNEKIIRSLDSLCRSFYSSVLWKDDGRCFLIILDECSFMKELHFRAPLFEAALSHIKIFDQYGEKQYRVSFDMKEETVKLTSALKNPFFD